jgi:chromosome partitioning protein
MAKIVAFVNQKGGVGKTATSHNTAQGMALLGYRTLLIDLDPSRNATKPFTPKDDEGKLINFGNNITDVLTDKNFDPSHAIYPAKVNNKEIEHLCIMPSHVSLALLQTVISSKARKEQLLLKQIEKIKGNFEYILIDCPPMLSEFSMIAIYAANFIVIPVRYEADALEGIADLFVVLDELKEDQYYDFKILRNGFDARKKTVISITDEELKPFIENGKVFKTIINQDEEINKAKMAQIPIFSFAPKSSGAMDYMEFTKELVNE